MSLLRDLELIDERLVQELDKEEELDETLIQSELSSRARILDELNILITSGAIPVSDVSKLIERSKNLKDKSEKLQNKLGNKLKEINKGKRLVKAYNSIKYNER
ncbi:hypothetical protein GU3_13440 [Oceanimonas sp. GK1]|uniref:hypothetical protein n=1 Tax=Oceanimonas sp. (strain GK1 / IBRC-M 10197) TaxID=511062 RepID=UPI0002495486|nr:hypothetical protein [Oceanimonas sp. GK1]AEY02441.1 hypothetical protein GU3_13440 [Oceanimonas sp. GK1]